MTVTKESAIAFRETWLRDLDRMERARLDAEWSADERAEFIRYQRAMVRRELAALRALPDDAPEDAVKRACGWKACCGAFHDGHRHDCAKHAGCGR